MQIANHAVVAFHYTLTDSEGTEIDSSAGGKPLPYLHGRGHIVAGLEAQLAGRSVGDQFEAVVSPAEGYGEHDSNAMIRAPLNAFPQEHRDQLQPGVQFEGSRADGADGTMVYRVAKIENEEVFADGNHPLAGVELHFAIKVVEVRAATAGELAQGHANAPAAQSGDCCDDTCGCD